MTEWSVVTKQDGHVFCQLEQNASTMSERGKKGEEDEFETFVRSTLNSLCQDIKEIKENKAKIQSDLQLLKNEVSSNKSEIKKIRESIDKATGDIHDANCRIDRTESDLKKFSKDVNNMYERLVSLERYSRDFNLRFYKVPESAGEDCILKLTDVISSDLNFQPTIENAHRSGVRREDGSPRPILAKFLYRPERLAIIKKKRDLKNNVRISEDLIWEDRERKKQLRTVMKEAYEAGNRPRFHHGKLYINGELYQS